MLTWPQIAFLIACFLAMAAGVLTMLRAMYALARSRFPNQIDPLAHQALQQAYTISREHNLALARRVEQMAEIIEHVKKDVVLVEIGQRPCSWAIADLKARLTEFLANNTQELIAFRRQIGELPPE